MNNKIFTFFLLLVLTTIKIEIYSQEKLNYSASYDILIKAVDLRGKGETDEAIKLFEQIYEGDSLFFKYALPEKMIAYFYNNDYDNVIELGDKYWNFRHKLPTEFYLLYGSSLDEIEEYDKAQNMYSEILKEFPMNYSLWYNYGVSLSLAGKHKKAYDIFKKTLLVNPLYDRVHHSLGLYAVNEKQTTKAIMAFGMYLILSGEKRDNFDQLSYADIISRSKYWTEEDFKGSNKLELEGNQEFSFIDQLIHNYIALEKKYKVKSKLSYPFVKQSALVFDQLNQIDVDENNIWHNNYVNFYIDLNKNKKFAGYSYYISKHIRNEKLAKIVKKNYKAAEDFRIWAIKNIYNRNDLIEVDFGDFGKGRIKRSNNFYVYIFGDFDYNSTLNILTGSVKYYDLSGRKYSEGNYDNDGKQTGKWKYYYPNGNLKEISYFDKGEYIDSSYVYLDNGLLRFATFYKNYKLNGDANIYTNGILDYITTFTDGEIKNGKYRYFYPIGTLKSEYPFVNGKGEGEYTKYFDSGEIEIKRNYLNGELEGLNKVYYRNGQISEESTYKNGLLEGPFTTYYENGQIKSKGKYLKDNKVGEIMYYFENGKTDAVENFDETGKENGTSVSFSEDGWKISEHVYKNGELTEYSFYDKDGKIISEDKRKSGNLKYKAYYENGNISVEGQYNKKGKNGKWKYYETNACLTDIYEYKDDLIVGEFKKLYPNGKTETTYLFDENGNSNGYYQDFYRNGNLYAQGYINNGNVDGPWEYYYRNGSLNKKMFYINGENEGFSYIYNVLGKLSSAQFFEKDLLKFTIYYDTAGMPLDTVFETPGKRTVEIKFCEQCPIFLKAEVFNNIYHGNKTYYYPDGNIASSGEMFNDEEHGLWKGFYANGEKRFEGNYEYGEKTGEWIYYNYDGSLDYKINYKNDKKHGAYVLYDNDGKIKRKAYYKDDNLHGEALYYIDGKNDHSRIYVDGVFVSYSYKKSNKTITKNINNETGEILIFWNNGKLARSFTLKNGWLEGKYLKYYENGNLEYEQEYINDWATGPFKTYYTNGNIREECVYVNGYIDGVYKKYFQNGKLNEICIYKTGEKYGKRTIYSAKGNLINKWIYFNNEIIEIEK